MSNPTKLGLLVVVLVTGCSRSFTADSAEVRHVFKVGDAHAPVDAADLEAVRTVVAKRLKSNPLTAEFIVETKGTDELLVLTPNISGAQTTAVQDLATRPGTLEFALLANSRDNAALIDGAESAAAADASEGEPQTAWIPLSLGTDGQPVDLSNAGAIVVRDAEHDGQAEKEVLVVLNAANRRLTDRFLKTAQREIGGSGNSALGFTFNSHGGYLMRNLTGDALPAGDGFKRRLGIILDGRLHSAPSINDVIAERGIIEGDFTQEQVDRMVISFNAGRLPLPVRFVESQNVGSE